MRKDWLLLLIIILFPGANNPGPDSLVGLMVEFIREPEKLKILDLKPEFTWIVPQEAKTQTSCQILVASAKENLEKNTGDIWNSQRIMSSKSSEVEYGGSNLSGNTTYYWKVRIWNSKQKPTKYSEIQSFTTGNPDGYSTTGNKFQSQLIKPEKVVKLTGYSYFIDFGKDAFGTLVLETVPTEWILHTVPMFYYDFMYTGNIESVKKYYEELKHKTLIALSREDGLISSKKCTDEIMTNLGFSSAKERLRDIVDWPPSQKDTEWKLATPEGKRDGYEMVEINTVVNAFYYQELKCMSELAGRLGKNEDSVFYQKQALKVKKTFNEKLLNKSTGIYRDGESSQHSSLHANMMALAFNLVPEENKKAVIDFIKSHGMACSVYGAQYLLEGLYNAGEADYAFSLLTATDNRSWWNMIKTGSTITMEAWGMKYKPNSDWNHAWGAAPANIIPRYVWGIAPVEPGYAKAIFKPQLSSLKYSKITVPIIRGNIETEFIVTGKTKEYSITIPANMECDFVLPIVRGFSVFLNSKKVDTRIKNIRMKPGLNKIIIKSAS